MDWLDRMNRAMDYIEEHLRERIDYPKIARAAACSAFHFQRMFPFIAGVSLYEYIRRRRLTMAAFELQTADARIIDVALKYGYESPEAFSRAFKGLHGIMPAAVRDKGSTLKAFPKMSFFISIKGDTEMNYRIEEKDGFALFGAVGDIDANQPFTAIPEFWSRCILDGTVDRIRAAAGIGEGGQLHAALHHWRPGVFAYLIGSYLPESGMPNGYEKLEIPKHTWAIFSTGLYPDGTGMPLVHDIWKRIFPEWFPTSGYEHADGPELEMTYDRGNGLYEMEVWIPVIRKQG